ncbi:hypothetical protein QFC21_005258 [Naganishia friedmannii]|uniref:Uncharacterized protein n=1 Tax=Naganishia friedmannii TaxID=89922 RepID=A0ACC2VC70_9TREE|nr:hypothetical protein QFC21_005258 [Naganishia friedmannii]
MPMHHHEDAANTLNPGKECLCGKAGLFELLQKASNLIERYGVEGTVTDSVASSNGPDTTPDTAEERDGGIGDNESVSSDDADAPEESAAPESTGADPGNLKAAEKEPSTIIPIVSRKNAQQAESLASERGTLMSTAPPSPSTTTVNSQQGSVSTGAPNTPNSTGKGVKVRRDSVTGREEAVPSDLNSTGSTPPSPSTDSIQTQKSSGISTQNSSRTTPGTVNSTAGESSEEGTNDKPRLPPPAYLPLPPEQVSGSFGWDRHDDGKTLHEAMKQKLLDYVALWQRWADQNRAESEKKKEEREGQKLLDEKRDRDRWNEFTYIPPPKPKDIYSTLGETGEEDSDGEKTPEGSLSPSIGSQSHTSTVGSALPGDKADVTQIPAAYAASSQPEAQKSRGDGAPKLKFRIKKDSFLGPLVTWLSGNDANANK